MVLITLHVKCNLEGIQTLYTPDDFTWLLKVKCSSCGEESPNWHTVDAQSSVDSKFGKATFNFVYKCKLCSRENSLDIIPASVKKLEADKCANFTPLVTFDCRGLEPIEYTPGKGWIAKAEESGTCFRDVDLTEKEWVDYDEKGQQSVGVYEFESQLKPDRSNSKPCLPDPGAPTYSTKFQMSKVPRKLSKMFGAEECQLCSVELKSSELGKMHYSGNAHMKKVKKWLTEWSLKTGRPTPNFEKHIPTSVDNLADYCDLCNIRLPTANDKILHYSGKIHIRNANKKGKTNDTVDPSTKDESIKVEGAKLVEINYYVCELCNVKAVSEDELNVHLGGKKHEGKLKNKELGLPPEPERPYRCDICKVTLETQNLYKLHVQSKRHARKKDSRGGTCEQCNIHFSSFNDYEKHLNGKKHETKNKENALRVGESVPEKLDIPKGEESSNCFQNKDLTVKEWTDNDERDQQSGGVFDLEAFI